jgi:hypothetical protein
VSRNEKSLEQGMYESHGLTVAEINTFQGEIDDSWVFFFHEVVLCKTLVMNNEIWCKLLTIESTQLAP